MKNRTMKRWSPFTVQTSTVKKSVATISSQCWAKNSFHVVFRARAGEGFDSVALQDGIGGWWCAPAHDPDSTARSGSGDNPNPGFLQSPCEMTSASISFCVTGRPECRRTLPSYLSAMSFRCHLSSVSGVTIVASSEKHLSVRSAGLWRSDRGAGRQLGEAGGCPVEREGPCSLRADIGSRAVVPRFIHPATAMSTKRNGSKVFGIVSEDYHLTP